MPNSTNMNTSTILTGTTAASGINTITIPSPTITAAPYYSTDTMIGASGNYTGNYTMGAVGNYTSNYTIGPASNTPADLIELKSNGKEIVRLTRDGSVVWASHIDVDEAAKAFSESLTIGSEMAAGITQRVKVKMRDSVFNDIIEIAKEKGSLTAEDLTYLLQASKMMEKLKGID